MKQDRSQAPGPVVSTDAGAAAVNDVAAVWSAHRHWVAAVLHAHRPRRAGSPDLEDLLQEVAMVLVRKQDELARIDAIEPWLRTVAVNIARDAGRRVTVAAKLDPMRLVEQNAKLCEVNSEDTQRGRMAMCIIEDLPTTYSEPLMLSLRGLSYRQISAVMNLPQSTIQNRLFRARAMVRDELAHHDLAASADTGRNVQHG